MVDLAHGTEHVGRLCAHEYAALRHTIAARGTARMLVAPASCCGWAALTLFAPRTPTAALLCVSVLVAGFEAVHALHVGSERIGRYIQVYYEAEILGPRWESTAMTVGPALPGGGIDPLFSGLFVGATLLNLIQAPLMRHGPTMAAIIIGPHVAFICRIIRARMAASRQRAVELESFKALQSRERSQG